MGHDLLQWHNLAEANLTQLPAIHSIDEAHRKHQRPWLQLETVAEYPLGCHRNDHHPLSDHFCSPAQGAWTRWIKKMSTTFHIHLSGASTGVSVCTHKDDCVHSYSQTHALFLSCTHIHRPQKVKCSVATEQQNPSVYMLSFMPTHLII